MARCIGLLVLFGACSGSEGSANDANHDPLRWTWSFVDPIARADVGCPPNVAWIELVAFEQDQINSECKSNVGSIAAQATFACAAGSGTLAPQPSGSYCKIDNVNFVRVIAKTLDSRTYANEGGMIDLGAESSGHTDIEAPRGFIRLAWTLVNSDNTPRQCPTFGFIRTTLTNWRLDTYPCDAGSAVLTGVVPSTYNFDVQVMMGTYSWGRASVSGVTVTADMITDATVTIPP